jgi:SAM-dependent methyltransferase
MTDDIKSFFGDNVTQIDDMIKLYQKNKDLELEVSFLQNEYYRFIYLMKKMIDITNENDIESLTMLDIQIPTSEKDNVRVTINDSEHISYIISNYMNKPHQLVPYLLTLDDKNDKDKITIIHKDRSKQVKHHLKDLTMTIRLTPEIKLKTIPFINTDQNQVNNKLYYRYKERVSFKIKNFSLDLTIVREGNRLATLLHQNSHYEIELEVLDQKISTKLFTETIFDIKKLLENTYIPISNSEQKTVIESYQQLLGIKNSHHLSIRYASSFEISNLNDIPSKYAVTDKADGERYLLFITDLDLVYLINNNLHVKKTPLKINDKKYHNTLIDGELIEIDNKKIFLAFDILYTQGLDFRHNEKYTLNVRLRYLNEILLNVFEQKFFIENYLDHNKDYQSDLVEKFYDNQIKKFLKVFDTDVTNSKNDNLLVRGKIYFLPYGTDQSEIFLYSKILWDNYNYANVNSNSNSKSKNKLYTLDGLVFTPLNYPYMIKGDLPELKWKPARQNSIDFYIKYERDVNNNISLFFDSNQKQNATKSYRICHLYVGSIINGFERPVPFVINGTNQRSYLYLDDNQVRDLNGDVIEDETVVEFIYDKTTDESVDNVYRWIPIKTRYDKTESVMRYQKKYGNEIHVAHRIWKSINHPITIDNIYTLSKSETFNTEFTRLMQSLSVTNSNSNTNTNKNKNSYYQKTTKLAQNMRSFHNWIKKNMIMYYCLNKKSVLDIGCGRGGDINKFISAKVENYVGIDIDYSGLYQITDSAVNRYSSIKQFNPDITKMYFIQADANALFNVNSQNQVLPNMSNENKNLIEKYLSRKFDVINCQFAIHYFLANDITWNNFIKNIKDKIIENGYLLITTLDGNILKNKLESRNKYSLYYTTNTGEKRLFFEFVKIYSNDNKSNIGLGIDVYNSMISDVGIYNREYLVDSDFLVKSLKDSCDLNLIESDTFENVFNKQKKYFTEELNSNNEDKNIIEFYKLLDSKNSDQYSTEDLEIARASFEYSKMNRYYVFQQGELGAKNSIKIINTKSNVKPTNTEFDLTQILSAATPTKWKYKTYLDPMFSSANANETYHQMKDYFKWTIVPNVFLIRHKTSNETEIVSIKSTNDADAIIIYKSLEKEFMPVYYKEKNNDKQFLFPMKDVNVIV